MTVASTHSGIVEIASGEPFASTLARVEAAITTAGLTIFARVEHAANAEQVGLAMPPATVVIYGNARGGTPIMLANPLAALDLPLRVLVREDSTGRTSIAFHPIAAVLRDAGVPEDLVTRLDGAQAILIKGLSS